jgi:hypothetical protein
MFNGSATPPVGGCTTSTSSSLGAISDNAGTLTISGGSIPPGTTLPPSFTYSKSTNASWFAAGQTLTVSGSGDKVPAFGPRSVVAAPFVTLTAPQVSGGMATISTSADLAVSWTGGQSGAVMTLSFAALVPDGQSPTLACAWDASLGHATVPKAALGQLTGPGTPWVSMKWGQTQVTTFMAGDYSVEESATLYSQASVTFQ